METISIIDDDEDFTNIMKFLLQEKGTITIYHEWKTALEEYAKQPPDLIMLDISLPDIDGTEVLKMIRDIPALQSVKVIAVTGYALPEDREKYLNLGFDEYAAKPITDKKRLISLIERVLA